MGEVQAKAGLIFSGGGARGAYQAGVLKGLAQINREDPRINPYSVITGVSAGAVNGTFMAAAKDDFVSATDRLCALWAGLTPERIFKADSFSLLGNGARVLRTLMFGGKGKSSFSGNQISLLNTAPSQLLFAENIDFSGIQENIDSGRIQALALSAIDYTSSIGVTFVQGKAGLPMWERSDRFSVCDKITVQHVLASSAIPVFFPAVRIKERYFGDGCLRNTAPLSPAIRLGANKLIVIGVRKGFGSKPELDTATKSPGIGKILNSMINSVMMDAMEMDLERMVRVNHTLEKIKPADRNDMALHPIDHVLIRPSADLGELAKARHASLPRGIRYLLAGLGSVDETADIVSYLLFEGSFCRQLIELGYKDCLARRNDIARMFLPN